jgi:hypothetical protein
MLSNSSRGSFAAAAIAAFAFALSCATPPAPTAAAAPAAPAPALAEPAASQPEKGAVPAPDEQRSRAAAARKRAYDLGIQDLLREGYAAAESAFADGSAAYGKDNEASAAAYADAAERFGGLVERGLPIIAGNERERAERLRAVAVGKRSEELFPEQFAWAEAEMAKPVSSESGGEFEAAIAGFRAAARNYDSIYKLCDARSARDAILARDFAKWDTSNWTIAETRYDSARSLLRTDAAGATSSADEAILRYGIVARNALEYYAGDRRTAAADEKRRAEGIKSEVAVKAEYAAALALHARAEAEHAAGNFDGSSSLHEGAAAAFASAYSHAKAKMDTAKDELDALDEALAAEEGI